MAMQVAELQAEKAMGQQELMEVPADVRVTELLIAAEVKILVTGATGFLGTDNALAVLTVLTVLTALTVLTKTQYTHHLNL
jgi:hypothetical protein